MLKVEIACTSIIRQGGGGKQKPILGLNKIQSINPKYLFILEPQSAAGKESAPDMTPDKILYKQNNNNVGSCGQYKNTLEIWNGSFWIRPSRGLNGPIQVTSISQTQGL